MSFVHLHTHTCYSLLDGAGRIPEILDRCLSLGMDSMAITDHGVMYGVIEFYKEAKKRGIKPIIGSEVYVTESRFEKTKTQDRYYHLVLLCENDEGYRNLSKIVSTGFTEGYYYKPRVDYEILRKYHTGIIALSACLQGEVAKCIERNDLEEAQRAALRYEEIFGKGNFFLELQDHGYPEQKKVNSGLLALSRKTGIGLVCTNDIHYVNQEDQESHDILLCLQTGKKLSDKDRMRYPGGQFYVKSESEMRELFPYAPEAVDNTGLIAERCSVEIEFGKYHLPSYQVPENMDSKTYLRLLSEEGLRKRYGENREKYRERFEYELKTINDMGFTDYFLIVWDYIHFAKTHDIAVGPGRGSAAGSIISYCIGITDIDPMKYSLIFERFLNPERVTMPDIDVDFEYERRQEVIDYVTSKYGSDCVSQIITFGTLQAKGVVRDVGRVMDIPYSKCDLIAKNIPQELGMTLDRALEESPDLKKMYNEDPETRKIIDMSKRLEGLPRHSSIHAAGVVISGKPVVQYVPLSRGSEGETVTQFTMTTIEELGLLKMDFLGLRTLTVIKEAIELSNKNHNSGLSLDNMDYEDKTVFRMISQGKCEGVFQLESQGMKNFMKKLGPESLEDIIAGVALYRPGPMDYIPKYIEGKKNSGNISYSCPEIKPILENTYGCIVYQEQVMQIVRDLAGYSMGRSDLVRRAMSKKKAKVMEEERRNFVYGNPSENIKGAVNNGIPEKTADSIYDSMIDFARYAFNKSHAACYAIVSYQTAYLRKYYPAEYFCSLMNAFMDNQQKVSEYIEIVKNENIHILSPDVNEAYSEFSVNKEGDIRYGLSAVKSVGRLISDRIVEEREKRGLFRDTQDFVNRMCDYGMNKRAMEYLIMAGAMDCFPGNRREKCQGLEILIDDHNKNKKNVFTGQMTLLDLFSENEDTEISRELSVSLPQLKDYTDEERYRNEKEALGFYLSGHPLDEYRDMLKGITNKGTGAFKKNEENEDLLQDQERVIIGGIITDIKTHVTKSQKQMAFISLEDLEGSLEAVVFPSIYDKYRNLLLKDKKLILSGRASLGDNEDSKLLVDTVNDFSEVRKILWIQFEDKKSYMEKWQDTEKIINLNGGIGYVSIYIRKERLIRKEHFSLSGDLDKTVKKLRDFIGKENVKYSYKIGI